MQVSAQNVGKNDMGAFTGEWTAAHLQDMEVGYTLIGHSERRSKYGETDEDGGTPGYPGQSLESLGCSNLKQSAFLRRHLWLQHDDQDFVGTEDVGRFVKLTRNDLLEQLPEGGCGELARDLTLIPNRVRDIGLMLRKLTIELIVQLAELQEFQDANGRKCIRKSGFLIDGHKGTGKSQVLNLVTMWARKNGWLVILEPNPGRYSREIADIKRSNNGVYIQSEFAQQFLEAMSLANRHLLQEIPVDYESYGSRGIDGEAKQATSRLYRPLIEKTVDTEVEEENLSAAERLERIAKYRRKVRIPSMVDVLQKPQNVWEIIEFGLDNEEYAVQAVAEAFVQLQHQTTHPVLVVVDAWNECFPCSEYVSIRYDNTRFNGYIPAFHLSMPRALHRWDGHKFRRGLKICATSWQHSKRRDYRPELLGVKDHEIRTVRNFTQQEFANYVMYLRIMNDTAVKVEKCQAAGLKVLFCIGELLEERESGKTDEVNKRQLAAIIPKVKNWDRCTYEIRRHCHCLRASVGHWHWQGGDTRSGRGDSGLYKIDGMTSRSLNCFIGSSAAIRAYIKEAVSAEVADKIRIQYGGSVTPENCKELIAKPNIDGFLVGGASLKPSFMEIVTAVQ
eukprot:symbB.v1.2.016364.t3/scaffold1243.1/size129491/6